MTVNVNAPPYRIWEKTTSNLYLDINYTKHDDRVVRLRIVNVNENGDVVDTQNIDVSNIQRGQTIHLSITLANSDLQGITVTPTTTASDTVPADGSKTYTAPADHYLFIEDVDGALVAEGYPSDWSGKGDGWIVPPGESITLLNMDLADHQVNIYYIAASDLNSIYRKIRFRELDANGNLLYKQIYETYDFPPIIVQTGGGGTPIIT